MLDSPVHLSSATVLGPFWKVDTGQSRETIREGGREGSLEAPEGIENTSICVQFPICPISLSYTSS